MCQWRRLQWMSHHDRTRRCLWFFSSLFSETVCLWSVSRPSPQIFSTTAGVSVTLLCKYTSPDADCKGVTWIFCSRKEQEIELGKYLKGDKYQVTGSCSLVIRKVTEDDAGHYSCTGRNRTHTHTQMDVVKGMY